MIKKRIKSVKELFLSYIKRRILISETKQRGESLLKVSIILNSYNRPQGVKEAFSSVKNQTYTDWELFIVDDNSNDQTMQVLESVENSDSRCKVIQSGVLEEDRPKTARYATCINLAIPKLTGDLVTYLIDDDIYTPKRLEVMVSYFRKYPDVHVVYGIQQVVHLRKRRVIRKYLRNTPGITRAPEHKVDHNSVMHRRSCFDVVKRWDDSSELWGHADAVFFGQLSKYWAFYPVNAVTDQKRIHGDSVQMRMIKNKSPY
jgi:spore maturation protein CgeD